MTLQGDPPAYKLAYDAGLRALGDQATVLREVRDRAGTLFSAAAIAGGAGSGLAFSVGWTIGVDSVGRIGALVALVAFVLVAVAVVKIWWPVRATLFQDSALIVDEFIEGTIPLRLPELHRELAYWLGAHVDRNRKTLEARLRWHSVGLLGLLAEILGIGQVLWSAID